MGCNDGQLEGITNQDIQTEPSRPDPAELRPAVAAGDLAFVSPGADLLSVLVSPLRSERGFHPRRADPKPVSLRNITGLTVAAGSSAVLGSVK